MLSVLSKIASKAGGSAFGTVVRRFGWKAAGKWLLTKTRQNALAAVFKTISIASTAALFLAKPVKYVWVATLPWRTKVTMLVAKGSAKLKAKIPFVNKKVPGAPVNRRPIFKRVAFWAEALAGSYILAEVLDIDIGDAVSEFWEDEDGDAASFQTDMVLAFCQYLASKEPEIYDTYLGDIDLENEDGVVDIMKQMYSNHPDEYIMAWNYAAEATFIRDDILAGLLDKENMEVVSELSDTAVDELADVLTVVKRESKAQSPAQSITNMDDLVYENQSQAFDNALVRELRSMFSSAGGPEKVAAIRDFLAMDSDEYIQAVATAYGDDFAADLAART